MPLVAVLLFVFIVTTYAGLYENTDTWPTVDNFCGGKRQSPIDVSDAITHYDPSLKKFEWKNFTKLVGDFSVINDGTTIKVTVPDGQFEVTMNGIKYDLDQYHIHWANDVHKGSEHTVNGKSYPMEIHFVHHKREYGSLAGSLNKADGLLVMGFIFKQASSAKADLVSKFFPVDIKKISSKMDQTTIPSFNVPEVMQHITNLDEFVLYPGSLTTPKCNEVVTWVFHPKPIDIDESLMSKIRSVSLDGGDVRNYREPQPLYDRKVQKSFPGKVSSTSATVPNVAGIILAIFYANYFNY